MFKVHGKKDLYIAVGDRWCPDYPNLDCHNYKLRSTNAFDPDYNGPIGEPDSYPGDSKLNTSRAVYTWLPIRLDGEMPIIERHDQWRIEDYE